MSGKKWHNGQRSYGALYGVVEERPDGSWLATLRRSPRRIVWRESNVSELAAKSSASREAERRLGIDVNPEPKGSSDDAAE